MIVHDNDYDMIRTMNRIKSLILSAVIRMVIMVMMTNIMITARRLKRKKGAPPAPS